MLMMRRKAKQAFMTVLGLLVLASSVLPLSPSGVRTAKAETAPAVKKFDFGTKTSPVMAGFTQVHEELLYTPELGYGLDKTVVSRLRSGGDDLFNDFVLGPSYTFMVDVPNGEYDVTVYSGDLLAGTSTTKTTTTLEGVTAGTITTKQAVAQAKYHTAVNDGQLTVGITGTGTGGYLNGLVIEQVIPQPPAVPQGLSVTGVTAAEGSASVSLQWSAAADASSYNVYRAPAGSGAYVKLAAVNSAVYTDTAISLNAGYSYKVSAVSASGLESALSGPVAAEVKPAVELPAAPSQVAVSSVTASSVALAWTAAERATGYAIFRAAAADGEFAGIGTSESAGYTDTAADTSAALYYKVKALNSAGSSDFSNVAASAPYNAPQPLPEGAPIRFDFGPGAVASGYIGVSAGVAYSPQLKYGFADPSKVGSGDRNSSDPLKSDFVSPAGTSFIVDLPNGDYTVSLIAGDQAAATDIAIKAETIQKVQQTSKAAGEYLEMSFDIALVDGQLNLDFTGSAPKINALVITRLPDRQAGEIPAVYIAGDSTVQTYDPYWKPEAGWGQMLPRFFTDGVQFVNHAIGGRSSKSFIVEGRLDAVLRAIKPGDYFLVQFGHNDATISVPDRYASVPDYKNYLKTYVNGARQRGATPILVTPMGRRDYNESTGKFNVSFPEYVAGMKEVAQELNVKLVDLSALSVAYYDSIGPAATLSVFLHVEPGMYGAFPNGSADNTHFQEYGAIQLARMLSGGIKNLGLPLSALVKDIEVPAQVPAKPTGLAAGSVSNAGAVLKWDAIEGADIYKIYRKLAADADYAMVGTATVPTLSLGGMSEGKTYSVRVTAVNGRGESEMSDEVLISTKSAVYRYDMGTASSPVMEGYKAVTLDTLYTPELGYGLTTNAGMITRDRGSGGSDLIRDWIGYFNNTWEFKADIPNGAYAVKLYVGDLLGSARTTVQIEGKDFGTVSAGKNTVVEKVINEVQVKDGQMNFIFGGASGIVNGIEITPILQSPTGLKLDGVQLDQEPPAVRLSWTAVSDAAKYRIYRKSAGASSTERIGETGTVAFTDLTADVGMTYVYTVTSLDSSGYETVPSQPLEVAVIDPAKPAPAVPNRPALTSIHKNEISFVWPAVDQAVTYNIYRAKKTGGAFELIGKTRSASYTDTTVLTTIPYYYKVAAVNAGGISGLSEQMATEAITVLSRQMEYIDRAPLAVKSDAGVYIGWRMLGTDADSITFNVYRDGVKLNDAPIAGSTNFLDTTGTNDSKYQLFTVENGTEKAASGAISVWQNNYLAVPLQKPADSYTKDGQPYTYSAGDASVGDLDGDGTYEIVMLWSPSNAKDNSQAGYTGIVYMDAYKLDGTRLWRINLGPNIRAGAHYTQFLVYDFDGDGKAEVAFKTADGTVDGTGQVIGSADADYRNSSGYVLLGSEYLTVFEGLTGRALATVDYDPPRGDVSAWGDAYGNRVDRFLATVAYLDGERPSMVFSRGYYTRTVLAAYNYRDGQLTKVWRFDTNDEGNAAYTGQGNHNLSAGDVDGDGKDEINFGAMAIDDDGTILYSTGLGHGDAQHFGDLDPARPGLEQFDVHEHVDSPYGMELRDAATGEIIWGIRTGIDTGRGMSADIDPNYLGEEFWAATITNAQHIPLTGLYNTKGELISQTIPSSTNFGVWWDGDLLRELQDANRIDKWDYVNHKTDNLFTAVGAASNNSTKANSSLQADLFGDWREEVMWRSEDSSEFRIYSTTDLTDYRIRTLMHDPVYRLGVAWQNVAYNQPPHPSFYLGAGMTAPPAPHMYTVGGESPSGDVTAPVISGLPPERMTESQTLEVQVTAEDPESGVKTVAITFDGNPVTNGQKIPLFGLKGAHTFTVTAVNHAGLTTVRTVNIQVTAADAIASTLTGPSSAAAGQPFDLAYGLSNVTQSVYAQDLTLSYNPDQLEFVSAESVREGFRVLAVSDPAQTPGQIRIVAAALGEGSAIHADGEWLKLSWKAKPLASAAEAAVSVVGSTVADGAGAEKQVEGVSFRIRVQPAADKTALRAAILDAQAKHDAAVEGGSAGQYPAGAKAALQSAIDKAKAAADNASATQAEVEQAVSDLAAALQAFAASVHTAAPGDANGDGKYSIGDLGIVAAAYGKTSADPDWSQYQKADINNDGKVDIVDLAAVARKILE